MIARTTVSNFTLFNTSLSPFSEKSYIGPDTLRSLSIGVSPGETRRTQVFNSITVHKLFNTVLTPFLPVIKFHLAPDEITDPPVYRTISCPADASLYMTHMALQLAFGWATTHSFDFAVANPDWTKLDDIMGFMAFIHQGMQVDRNGGMQLASAPRQSLFRVTDVDNYSPFSGVDRMHEGRRRHPNTPEKKADKYHLHQLLDDPKWQGKKMLYTYDFGDMWEHDMTVQGRAKATRDFQVLDGSGHPVAEDAGGVMGWEELKAAYRTANPTSEQKETREWFEERASNGDPRGLAGDRVNFFDKEAVNKMLSENLFGHFNSLSDRND